MQTAHKTDPVSKLIFELSKLPGIGEKTATRLAYYILKQDESYSRNLADALMNAKQKIILCGQCFTFTDTDPCRICANHRARPGLDLRRRASVGCFLRRTVGRVQRRLPRPARNSFSARRHRPG